MAANEQEYTLPDGVYDPLARMGLQRFYDAQRVRASFKLGDKSVDQVLRECWEQYHGVADCVTAQMVERTGVDLKLNLTQLKAGALQAWMRDILMGSMEMPWTVDPTPIPELSKAAKEAVLFDLKVELFRKKYDGDVPELVRALRAHHQRMENDRATGAARAMETLLHDQAVEGDFRSTFMAVLQDFAIYPYAVMEGPIRTIRPEFVWQGNKQVSKLVQRWVSRRVSPFDFFWSADSPDPQRGSYVCIKHRMTRGQLTMATTMPSYIQRNVEDALGYFSRAPRDWLNPNPERPGNLLAWKRYDTIDVIKQYGTVSSDVLSEYGLSLDKGHYECEIVTLGHFTIKARVLGLSSAYPRPVQVTSFEKGIDQIPGFSIPQKVRDIERAYHSTLRALIRNNHYSSGPIGEVDFSRVSRWINEDDIGQIDPYTMYPTDPDMTGGGRPAHYFHNTSNVAASLIATMEFFERKADRFTQIPASIHGEPVGSGANRTFRGVTFLYSNALKGLQSALTNIDLDIISPYAQTQAHLNLQYEGKDNPTILEGDVKVRARGSTGLLQREIDKQASGENLALVAKLASSGQVKPAIVDFAVRQALAKTGIPVDELDPEGAGDNPLQALMPTAQAQPPSPGFANTTLPVPAFNDMKVM